MRSLKALIMVMVFYTALLGVIIHYSWAGEKLQGRVIIFHAGSLSVPFEAMERAFEEAHPEIDIVREASGSVEAARKISELHKPCDIMASADYEVIDKILIPLYADWNIRFASNQLVLCYTKKSRYATQINARNWYQILQRKDVVWGHSDPNLDPCGYRALMVMQLAEKYYRLPGLYNKLLSNRPQIRPKSVELVSLLQTGNMDYAWEYLSVAVQHGLKYVTLPDQINLGNYAYDPFYAQAVVRVAGEKPGSFIEMKGKSCTYGITLLRSAPNRKAAIAFLAYMLDPKGGLKILKAMGQPPLIPCKVSSQDVKDKLPEVLRALVDVDR
ncbi:tungstate/molybdate binding protein [Thermodesulforhabdus norvegica]|uniref:Tungstate/molybdate binding protein n=2 Tax=Thermodesulforhabdus norvegica TaxID=39841 RepID=A0A1I4S3K5_9BACT|nr:tungstate ABC transporter substrate-binding protein WtpA [Thermodesulforhabdus norvegica]SFM59039.1 tungstate/molybdate binding protein [Thermodesulforhabdus norvegica]